MRQATTERMKEEKKKYRKGKIMTHGTTKRNKKKV
jgi:hypothetical protein